MKVQGATEADEEMQFLRYQVALGWPVLLRHCMEAAKPYWNAQELPSVHDGMMFCANRAVVPSTLRSEVLSQLHEGNLGVIKMMANAKATLYWSVMIQQLEGNSDELSV